MLHDCPGHAQYTRNMVTGASTADLAVILVDARRGLTEQSRRHAALAGLLGVPQITVCVNKMDLVGYAEERFDTVVREFLEFAAGAGLSDITFIPVSALHGDNVVDRSQAMPWYAGEPLLAHLEGAPEAAGAADGPARLPVQYVIRARRRAPLRRPPGLRHAARRRRGRRAALRRPQPRGARGRPARRRRRRGRARLGVRRARGRARRRPRRHDRPRLRGARGLPRAAATLCWLGDAPARAGATYLLKHTTRTVRAKLDAIEDRLDVTTLERAPADELELNAIGRVRLRLGGELAADPYAASPRDRRVHPHRRGDERHRRRRHGGLTRSGHLRRTPEKTTGSRPARRPHISRPTGSRSD